MYISHSEPKELTQARQFIKEGKYEDSIRLLKDFEGQENLSLQDIVSCHLIKCNLLIHQSLYEKAAILAEQTYKESLGLEKNILSVDALIMMTLSMCYFDVKTANMTIKQGEELLKTLPDVSEIQKNRRKVSFTHLKGMISDPRYSVNSDIELAIKHYRHSLDLGESLGDTERVIASLLRIAMIISKTKGDLDLALDYIERALALSKNINYKLFIAWALYSKAMIYHSKGEVSRSIPLYKQSLAIAQGLNHKQLIFGNLNNMADTYRMIGELDHALEYSKQSVELYSEKDNFFFYRASSLDFLIQILTEKGDLEQAQQFLNQLEQMSKELHNKTITLLYLYNKALLLKKSPRISNRGKAEEILKQILGEEELLWEIKERALLALCELLLSELQLTGNLEVLEEVESYIAQLLDTAEKSHSYWILGETILLKAKLALISFNLKEARQLLTQGQKTVEKYGLKLLAMKISNEHDELLKRLNEWDTLKDSNAPLTERMDLSHVDKQIDLMVSKKAIDTPKLEPEHPILVTILTEDGKAIFSNPFTADMTVDGTRFGKFLSSFNMLSNQLFLESFDRVKFGQYTVLIKSVDSLSICYMFQGQTFSAQQKLIHFTEALKKEESIRRALINTQKVGGVIKLSDNLPLDELLLECFLSDPKQFQVPFKAYVGNEPFIFISYSHTDKLHVYPIIDYLNDMGLNIWYDEGIPISENWKKSIVQNLERCQVFLVFITSHIIDSEMVRKEISFALKKKKKFIAIYLKETNLPSELEFEIADIQALMKFRLTETEFYDKLKGTFDLILSE